ncbi:hypothetical protein SAMN04488012_11917 [Palleronia salina]|uniref:Uncharacterized protein n=1 Tax=Palleronia salina TaxID=313368 RepID=A0A1M6M2N1_9RHOB|nr:hypothetical protein [Palleronia salina]SHJ77617.1 hypothetical protein SAMN04488012_11917 [Palleronia salina]
MNSLEAYLQAPAAVARCEAVLADYFPSLSQGVCRLQAHAIVNAVVLAEDLHHGGAAEKKELARLDKQLQKVRHMLCELSPWAQQALLMVRHDHDLARADELRSERRAPQSVPELAGDLMLWIVALRKAEEIHGEGRAGHGKNWPAIAVIDEGRKAWCGNEKKAPPPYLNPGTRLASFLQNLLDACGVDAEVESAYRAWRQYTADPHSPFDL